MKVIVGLVLSALTAVITATPRSNKDVYQCTVEAKKGCIEKCHKQLADKYDASVFNASKVCFEAARKERTACVKKIPGLEEYSAKPCSWHHHHHAVEELEHNNVRNPMVDCIKVCRQEKLDNCFEGCAHKEEAHEEKKNSNEKDGQHDKKAHNKKTGPHGHPDHGKSKSAEHSSAHKVWKALRKCKHDHPFKTCRELYNKSKQ